ncbi:CD225/dispanin family protein [Rhodococcus sp. IEGM 1341]|uniref:CD225/dispanin family protein n=2 Tax=unclassified Rhodococcus (in: high G+C Gram-positive bacteria) TaxID=192944 RepID=UPI0011ED154D|nr:CD225/dispanin family protein [Rhodococcus sp. IEGM 1341]KAA0923259.1 CD225/dispanin family protein [Rhodococcus sp. ANT_H53B]MDI9927557.1 CD225/dispanin family protein [Rhodococcus sp. IEGM 1341]
MIMSNPYQQSEFQQIQQPYPAAQPYAQASTLPSSNAGWAVVAIIFFWPLAIPAFNHALKVHPLWMMGDAQGAFYSSNRAGFFGKLSLGIFVVLIVLYFAFIALVVANSY